MFCSRIVYYAALVVGLCHACDRPVAEIHVEWGEDLQDFCVRRAPNEIGQTRPVRRDYRLRLGEKLNLGTQAHLLEFTANKAPAGKNRKNFLLVRNFRPEALARLT